MIDFFINERVFIDSKEEELEKLKKIKKHKKNTFFSPVMKKIKHIIFEQKNKLKKIKIIKSKGDNKHEK